MPGEACGDDGGFASDAEEAEFLVPAKDAGRAIGVIDSQDQGPLGVETLESEVESIGTNCVDANGKRTIHSAQPVGTTPAAIGQRHRNPSPVRNPIICTEVHAPLRIGAEENMS